MSGTTTELTVANNKNFGMASAAEHRQLTAADIRNQVNLIQSVMKSIMKEGTHYGVIAGCKQPTLYKAGSEVLLTTFRIAVEPLIEDLSTDDVIRYRVKTVGIHHTTGNVIGYGIGECSSNEEKYKWRSAVCDQEWDQTDESRRRIKFNAKWDNRTRTKSNITQIKQIRTEPADLANTILKMAKKRSQIDLTLTATAASDIFTQDIEDLPDEYKVDLQEEGGSSKQAEQSLPSYSDEQFEGMISKWRAAIEKGKSPQNILNKVNSKYALTPEQKTRILNLKGGNNAAA